MDDVPSFYEHIPRATYCPACDLPPTDDRAEVALCTQHLPSLKGADDGAVTDSGYFNIAEAGPNDVQALIR